MTCEDKRLVKRSKRKARKARAQEQSRAIAAAQWEPRPDSGKDRPTPERIAKGAFKLVDGEDAGVTVAVDTAATTLDRMAANGIITPEQAQGGHDFAALLDRTRLVSQGRSCLNFEPVGHEDDSPPSHAELRDQAERREIYLACGMLTFAELRRVCCDGDKPRDLARLKEGLDICVKFWH